MTRAEFIKEAVKQLFGVKMDEKRIIEDTNALNNCWSFKCPNDDMNCEECPYKGFWEKEV